MEYIRMNIEVTEKCKELILRCWKYNAREHIDLQVLKIGGKCLQYRTN